MAAAMDFFEVIHLLTLRGVDYEYKMGDYKKTALHIAVEYGNELSTKLLLNNGADLNQKDFFGFDIFNKAELRGNYRFLDIFDHFCNGNNILSDRKNIKQRELINYDEKRYCGPFKVEDIDVGHYAFRPTDLLEFHFQQGISDKFVIDNFAFFCLKDDFPKHPYYIQIKNNDLGSNFGEVYKIKRKQSNFIDENTYRI